MAKQIEWPDFSAHVAEYIGTEKSEIKDDTNLYSDLGLDSLGLFSLGMFLIKTYGVEIPLSAVTMIETIGDIYRLMNNPILQTDAQKPGTNETV
jgi:acyl carrier protein